MSRRKNHYRNNWLEATFEWSNPAFRIGIGNYNDNRVQIQLYPILGKYFIALPWKTKHDGCDTPEYGFSFTDHGLHLNWGYKVKILEYPWAPTWTRTSVLLADGTWAHDTRKTKKDFWKDEWQAAKWSETHPYIYQMKNGTTQERTARITVEEREWRPKWFTWCPLLKRVRKSISVDFSDEVGERTGSWKGGTVGCGYELKENESPIECLRRMEAERKFN